jgi:hypothetical protein
MPDLGNLQLSKRLRLKRLRGDLTGGQISGYRAVDRRAAEPGRGCFAGVRARETITWMANAWPHASKYGLPPAPRTGTFARAGKIKHDAWTTRLGRRRDKDAPSVNAPTWEYTGAVNAGRRPIRKFQMKKPAASFPARAQLLR